jgi:hypothetical protein
MAIDRPAHSEVAEFAQAQLRPTSWPSPSNGPLGNGWSGRIAGDFAPPQDRPGAAHRRRLPLTLIGV